MSTSGSASLSLRGSYRVQSRRQAKRATLLATSDARDDALARAVNEALAAHPLRSPGRSIALRAVRPVERTGVFASCPDVLYKHDLFTADEGTPALTTNLVDLEKVEQRWRSTATTFGSLWSPRTVERLETIDPREVFRHEYFVHEAGHLVGFDVDAKVSSGYFRPGGRLAWRLVYVEEVRADLHALALATEVLQVEQAVDVFYGHVATRFGMMAPEDSGGKAPFGLVPYLLYVALAELGLVTVHGSRFVVCRERSADIASGMQACGAWATERLTGPELMSPSLEGRGLVGAAHVRRCLEHPMLLSSYCRVRGPVA